MIKVIPEDITITQEQDDHFRRIYEFRSRFEAVAPTYEMFVRDELRKIEERKRKIREKRESYTTFDKIVSMFTILGSGLGLYLLITTLLKIL